MPSQYCQPADITSTGIPATAIPASITAPMLVNACIQGSARADAYMRGRYPMPITGSVAGGPGVFDPALVMNVAYIAAYIVMSLRGFQPNAEADRLIVANYYSAIGNPEIPGSGFFPGVERQNIHLDVTFAAPQSPKYNLPAVTTSPSRGIYGRRGD